MTAENVKKVPVEKNAPAKNELTPLQKFMEQSDVLLMLYPKDANGIFSDSIKPEDELALYDIFKQKKDKKEKLLILLDTSGGNVYSAVKIMDTLRTHYQEIIIAIPQEAKSSGTMMCCGADRLVMGPISELGPLDKPMRHPTDDTTQISALDIVKSIDEMIDTALEKQKILAEDFVEKYGIPIKTSLPLASESIAALISPMLCREDVKIYNEAKRLLNIAVNYGTELLTKHMFKYIQKEKVREKIVEIVIRRLVWLYPDHSFAIRRHELEELLFRVDKAEDTPYWEELWKEFAQNIGSNRGKVIKYL